MPCTLRFGTGGIPGNVGPQKLTESKWKLPLAHRSLQSQNGSSHWPTEAYDVRTEAPIGARKLTESEGKLPLAHGSLRSQNGSSHWPTEAYGVKMEAPIGPRKLTKSE